MAKEKTFTSVDTNSGGGGSCGGGDVGGDSVQGSRLALQLGEVRNKRGLTI